MSPWRARLAVAAIFVLGFLCGALAMHIVRLRVENRLFRAPDAFARIVVFKLNQELRLTQEQRREVYLALVDARLETIGALRESMPKLLDVAGRTEAKVRAILNDEQRAKFDRIVERRHKMLDLLFPQAAPAPTPAPSPGAR